MILGPKELNTLKETLFKVECTLIFMQNFMFISTIKSSHILQKISDNFYTRKKDQTIHIDINFLGKKKKYCTV